MKKSPKELKIQERMQPGVLTRDGFLGDDTRCWTEIVEEDEQLLKKLNVEPERIADRLESLMEAAMDNYLGEITLEDRYKVEYQTFRGFLVSPFMHPGRYRKGLVRLHDTKTGLTLHWTPLSVHLIRDHHFFGGRGSQHRLDPTDLVQALFQ